MNKDVIYIEAEDDITDIITKIENSKEKINEENRYDTLNEKLVLKSNYEENSDF